jgi:hypothetical protein
MGRGRSPFALSQVKPDRDSIRKQARAMEHKLLQIAVGVVIGLAEERTVAPPIGYWQGASRGQFKAMR